MVAVKEFVAGKRTFILKIIFLFYIAIIHNLNKLWFLYFFLF